MYIASKDNPKIKLYTKLATSKKSREENALFVLEGARLCSEAIGRWKEKKLDIHSVFSTQKALDKYPEYIDSTLFTSRSETFHIVDEKVSEKLGETKNSQGVYIIGGMSNNILSDETLKHDGKYLVMNNLQDPGNVGTILRTCDAVGADGVIMTNNCCDLYNPKTLRSAMGSLFRLNVFVCDDFSEVCEVLKKCNIKTYAAVVDRDAQAVDKTDFSHGVAVVIGNEGRGIQKEDVALCDSRLTIKMQGNIESLNAAMAAGIILWEMKRSD
ncbi:MAG: RNA methyltransferase [Ruminococcus sp.]|nr:RNA methyltransferase [Ruminococcus sp.]